MGAVTGFQSAYLVDIAVMIVLLIFALVDAKKGFIACIFGLVISVVAFIVAFFCASTVVDATGGLFGVQDLIGTKICEVLSGISVFQVDATQEGLATALQEAKLPAFLVELISKNGIQAEEGMTLAQYISGEVAPFITLVLTGIVLFILCKLVLNFVEKILTSLVKNIAFLGAVNGILGALVGFIKGAFTVCLVLALLSLLTSPEITAFIDQTLFVKTFYHENPVNLLYGLIFVNG
jgi:uncharacterized membrane protein required for colicin V production